MGDYLRLLTISDREIPLANLQRAASVGAVWSVDHPGMLGNYLEQSAKLFMDMQQRMQDQTRGMFATFPFPGFSGPPGAAADDDKKR